MNDLIPHSHTTPVHKVHTFNLSHDVLSIANCRTISIPNRLDVLAGCDVVSEFILSHAVAGVSHSSLTRRCQKGSVGLDPVGMMRFNAF